MALILVVDDDELVRMNLEMVLRMEGYEVRTADCGESALAVADVSNPDLVVLDITMPRMSGWEALSRFRLRPEWTSLPIVALTGDEQPSREFREAGFSAHLSKGGSLENFLCTIRTGLSIPRDAGSVWLHSCNGERCLVSPTLKPIPG